MTDTMLARTYWPDDIPKDWLNVVRRMHSAAANCQKRGINEPGIAMLNVLVILDQNGRPVLWTPPSVTRWEPEKRSINISEILSQI